MHCHLGDTAEYLALVDGAVRGGEGSREGRGQPPPRTRPPRDLAALKRGDVIEVPTGRRSGLAVVLDPGFDPDGGARPLVVTAGRWAGRLSAADFRGPVPALGRIKLGKFTDHRSPKVRRDIASALASSGIAAPSRQSRRGVEAEDVDLTRAASRRARPSGARLRATATSTCSGPGAGVGSCRRTSRSRPRSRTPAARWARRWTRSSPCSTTAATCTATRSTRPAGCWRASGRRATSSSPSACGGTSGAGSIRRTSRRRSPALVFESRRENAGPRPSTRRRRGGRHPRHDPDLGRDRRAGKSARAPDDPRARSRVRRRGRRMGPRRVARPTRWRSPRPVGSTSRPAISSAGAGR